MKRIRMTMQIAHAAAMDTGNRSAKTNGRTVWTQEDYDAAAVEYLRLWPLECDR